MKKRKLVAKILSGSKNISFSDAKIFAEMFGFRLARISGSHHIYIHPDVPELVNLHEVASKANPYQLKQLIQIIERYDLRMEVEE